MRLLTVIVVVFSVEFLLVDITCLQFLISIKQCHVPRIMVDVFFCIQLDRKCLRWFVFL